MHTVKDKGSFETPENKGEIYTLMSSYLSLVFIEQVLG